MDKNEIYIGDNLAIMRSAEFKKFKTTIDFIYIDPPYNTKNSKFAYSDNNSKWSLDIKLRLIEAKELLKKTGVIFISIDDNEFASLLQICDEVFGKENKAGIFITKQSQRSNAKHINVVHEYVVAYAKSKTNLPRFYVNRIESPLEGKKIKQIIQKVKTAYKKSSTLANEILKKSISDYVLETGETWIVNYSNIDENGEIYFAKDLSTPGEPNYLKIDEINLTLEPLKTRGWSSKQKFIKLHKENKLCFKNERPYEIEYLKDAVNNVSSVLDFYSRQGTNDLKKLGLNGIFDTPKPVELIKFLIRCSQHKNALILDFYAGSGTTAQAVYEINQEDKKQHKYILIQLPEPINNKNKAFEILTNLNYKEPKISDAMILRINKFAELNKIDTNYQEVVFSDKLA